MISVAALRQRLAQGEVVRIFDCTGDLMKPENGPVQYREQHIAGARYADLNLYLSAHGDQPKVNGGRHPVPTREDFARWLGSEGVGSQTPVVVYDRNGVNYCGRLWWMLRWCGHGPVWVLDGGLQAWVAANGEVASGDEAVPAATEYVLGKPLVRLVHTTEVAEQLGRPGQTLIDARAVARFKGEVEPLDPIAGHIPGALNRPFALNIGSDGLFKPTDVLRQEFDQLLAGRDPAGVVHHCGSGVSAVPNLLAMEIAGLGTGGLYAGSWSEWSNTPGLPCAQG
ncbi:MAG: sulfurtransferase [Alphaproteobacteria bacterium]|nr:sulfurtransferase [Alphaproteobacteria bacterium]